MKPELMSSKNNSGASHQKNDETLFNIVNPVKPVAPWLGGKSRLAKTIVPLIEVIPHHAYIEPFVGMGGVFLRRTRVPKAEVINDYSGDVANLFRILQNHYQALIDHIRWQLTARSEFNRMMGMPAERLTDIQRAARFLYLQRLAFGGKTNGTFGVSKDRPARFDIAKLEPLLADVHERLSAVTIECLDFADLVKRYDQPAALFYLDPPYWGNEKDYGKEGFTRDRFKEMALLLRRLKGAFILSLNDCEGVRNCFKAFHMMPVQTSYSIAKEGHARGVVGELLISNLDLEAAVPPTG